MNICIMKKILSFLFTASALLTAVSCAEELAAPQAPDADYTATLVASFDEPDTKTVLDGKVSKWSGEEWIQVIGNSGNYWMSTNASTPAASATFYYNGGNGEYNVTDIMAVYPAGSHNYKADFAAKTVSLVQIPAEQKATAGTYDKAAVLSLAYSPEATNDQITFKNAVSLLKFKVTSNGVTDITFYGNHEEKITGGLAKKEDSSIDEAASTGKITYDAATGKAEFSGATLTYAKLLGTFEKGKTYYMAIAPGTFSEGVSLEVNGNNLYKESEASVTFERNVIYDMGEIFIGCCLTGTHNGWGTNDADLTEEGDFYVIKNFVVAEDAEFKFRLGNTYIGGASSAIDTEITAIPAGDETTNIAPAAGTYDIYLRTDLSSFYIMTAGKDVSEAKQLNKSGWTLAGSFGGENRWTYDTGYYLTEGAEYFECKNLTLAAEDEFKVLSKDNEWLGGTVTVGAWANLAGSGNNISVAAGTYDVYFDAENKKLCVVTAGAAVPDQPTDANTTGWAVVGSIASEPTVSWDYSLGLAFEEGTDYIECKGIELTTTDTFKVLSKDGVWRTVASATVGEWLSLIDASANIKMSAAGTYDIYMDTANSMICFVAAGAAVPAKPTTTDVTIYLSDTTYWDLWCWSESANYTGGEWPGVTRTGTETIDSVEYAKWVISVPVSEIGKKVQMIFSHNYGNDKTSDSDKMTLAETMYLKIDNNKPVLVK